MSDRNKEKPKCLMMVMPDSLAWVVVVRPEEVNISPTITRRDMWLPSRLLSVIPRNTTGSSRTVLAAQHGSRASYLSRSSPSQRMFILTYSVREYLMPAWSNAVRRNTPWRCLPIRRASRMSSKVSRFSEEALKQHKTYLITLPSAVLRCYTQLCTSRSLSGQ